MKWGDVRPFQGKRTPRCPGRAGEKRSPAWNTFSTVSPRRMSRSFIRTCALPRPILMCWKSRICQTRPSSSIVMPRLIPPVLTNGSRPPQLETTEEPIHRLRVSLYALADDGVRGDIREVRDATKRLPLRDVGDVDLDDRKGARGDRVPQHHRGVRQPARVNDAAIRV